MRNNDNRKEYTEKILHEIATDISSKYNTNEIKHDLGLLSGKSGVSLFMFYISRYFASNEYERFAQKLLESTFDDINSKPSLFTYCGGLAGVGWCVDHLSENCFIEQNNIEVLNDLDGYLFEAMSTFLSQKNFDFLHGATGIVFYFLDRLKYSNEVQKYLSLYLEELYNYAIIDEKNKTAKIISNVMDENDKPKQVYNLSLSHGMSSVIIILCKMYPYLLIQNDKTKCKKMIEYFTNYILTNEMVPDEITFSRYPSWVELNANAENNYGRLAWCYGDIGNGLSFYNAYKVVNNELYLKKANEIFESLLHRKSAIIQGIKDTGLCHGTSGIAIISNRLCKSYGMEYDEVTDYWFNLSLDYYKEKGLRGFGMFTYNEGYKDEISILNGTSGIGLGLLSCINKEYMNWDRMLLLS